MNSLARLKCPKLPLEDSSKASIDYQSVDFRTKSNNLESKGSALVIVGLFRVTQIDDETHAIHENAWL